MTRRPGRARPITAGLVAAQGRRACTECGMVTAEFAVALPAFVVVVIAALSAVVVVTAQLQCTDAAELAARLAARGESGALVRSTALAAAPGRASLSTVTTASTVTVTVTSRVSLPGITGLPGIDLKAVAVEAVEPSAATTDSMSP